MTGRRALVQAGSDKLNPKTGLMDHYDGHLFDEGVFNDSVREFLRKRRELADYFDESKTEDIFDYIPPQKTNQIFTPKRIVKMMVDKLEEENPGCFDDPEKTFADLYMKSGLYITEVVKRLYRSEKMKVWFPDDKERIRHILQKQVYGMAPTRIIYLIATNYILGFDKELKEADHHFVQADAAEAAKSGTLQELVNEHFGNNNEDIPVRPQKSSLINGDFLVRCKRCKGLTWIDLTQACDVSADFFRDRPMGPERNYSAVIYSKCKRCGNELELPFDICEYPLGTIEAAVLKDNNTAEKYKVKV